MDNDCACTKKDRIIIKELALSCRIGITADERMQPQPLSIDLELMLDLREAGRNDDIAKTINYSSVCNDIRTVADHEYCTIEAVAECIATAAKQYGPGEVHVVVRKPGALARKGARYAAVEIYR